MALVFSIFWHNYFSYTLKRGQNINQQYLDIKDQGQLRQGKLVQGDHSSSVQRDTAVGWVEFQTIISFLLKKKLFFFFFFFLRKTAGRGSPSAFCSVIQVRKVASKSDTTCLQKHGGLPMELHCLELASSLEGFNLLPGWKQHRGRATSLEPQSSPVTPILQEQCPPQRLLRRLCRPGIRLVIKLLLSTGDVPSSWILCQVMINTFEPLS